MKHVSNLKIPNERTSRTRWLCGEIFIHWLEELTIMVWNYFRKLQRKEHYRILLYEASITLITKLWQRYQEKRKLQASMTDEHRWKNRIRKLESSNIKRIIEHDQREECKNNTHKWSVLYNIDLLNKNYLIKAKEKSKYIPI